MTLSDPGFRQGRGGRRSHERSERRAEALAQTAFTRSLHSSSQTANICRPIRVRIGNEESMLLTLTTTEEPAADLGYLLGKNPARCQSFPLSFGQAHVFYPEVSPRRCTAALLLDVNPVGLVRNRRGPSGEGQMLEQYVNDRPYVASSFLSVAIAQVYGSALAGPSKERSELADTPIPLEARLAVLPLGVFIQCPKK
jgi:hypothetical protein